MGTLGRIMVVDDEKNMTHILHAMLERAGFEAIALNATDQALEVLGTEEIDLLITDLRLVGTSGLELLAHCQEHYPLLPVVMITAHGTIEAAVEALKRGAFDFITKPFDHDQLISTVQKAVASAQARQREPQSLGHAHRTPGSAQIHRQDGWAYGGQTPLGKQIEALAESPLPLLILGERGTGKEFVASEIHRRSERKSRPFLRLHCATPLMELDLFGFEPGIQSGMRDARMGRLELAHLGTLFLDEVCQAPLEVQARLEQFFTDRSFARVGSAVTQYADVRIIASSHRSLLQEIKQRRFRMELHQKFFHTLRLPPLRERRSDIPALVRHLMLHFSQRLHRRIDEIAPQPLQALVEYDWPGNLRQLENTIERMVLLSDGPVLTLSDLPDDFLNQTDPPTSQNFKQIVRKQTHALEFNLITAALEKTAGNVTHAAESLGLSRKGLQLKMKELGMRRH